MSEETVKADPVKSGSDWVDEACRCFIQDAADMEPTNPVKAIETHFDKHASDALKASVKAEGKTAEGCWKFIFAVARKALNGSSGHIDPAVVYAIAMHYFQDVPALADFEPALKAEKASKEIPRPKPEVKRVAKKPVKRAAARRRIAREKAEQEEWERTQMALMRERTQEIAAFQRSIDRFKRLNLGDGVTCVLAKSQDELRAEGRSMCNCVGCGTYGRGIVLGNTLILMIRRNGKPFVDVEIDRRTWTVRQCYAKRNTAAPEEISRAADEIAQILKRQHQKMRKGKAA